MPIPFSVFMLATVNYACYQHVILQGLLDIRDGGRTGTKLSKKRVFKYGAANMFV